MYPSKKQLSDCQLSDLEIPNSPKKQKINEIRHHQTLGTQDADPRKWDKMPQFRPSQTSKNMQKAPVFDVLPPCLCTFHRRRISPSDLI